MQKKKKKKLPENG